MLQVPRLRQPDEVACLATCVRAVLAYHGRHIGDDEAANACGTRIGGTLMHLAIEGLTDAGLDVGLCQLDSADALAEVLEDDRPAIVVLRHYARSLHAVVVCHVGQETVTVMDPAVGDYRAIRLSDFTAMWFRVQGEALLVGRGQRLLADGQ